MTYSTFAQSNTVTIIGDPMSEVSNSSGGGGNPYIQSTSPEKDQQLASPQNIEPTFENGFHIRYDVPQSEKVEERPGNTGYEYASIAAGSAGGSSGAKVKRKHSVSFTERTFYFKKKVKAMMPKRKKKYRPNVCGRF